MEAFGTEQLMIALNLMPFIGMYLYYCDMCVAKFRLRMGHVFGLHRECTCYVLSRLYHSPCIVRSTRECEVCGSGSQVTIRLSNPSVGSLDNGRLVIGPLPAQTQPLKRNDRGGHFTPQRSACPCVRYTNKCYARPSPYVGIYRVPRPG
jgi:hypothetical protein